MKKYGRGGKRRNMKSRSVLGLRITRVAEKVKGVLSAATEVAHVVNDITGRPKIHNYVAVGTIALNKVAGYFNFDPTEDPTMREPLFIPFEMRDFLRKIARSHPTEYHGGEGGQAVQVSDIHGHTVIFRGEGWDIGMWFQTEEDTWEKTELELVQAFGRATWEMLGTSVEAVSPDKNGPREDMTYIKPWKAGEILKSDQTKDVLDRTKAFLRRGKSRSLLLYGPPGTGKSCMIRAIADEIKGTTLFLDSTQLDNIDSKTLSFFLDYLAPDIVLIDDLDRVDDVKDLLSAIDRIKKGCKLLMVTVNHIDKVDAAVKRAGRFDDWVEVTRVRRAGDIIPGLDEKIRKEIDDWPVAFITELKERIAVLGKSCLDREMEDLRKRVKTNS
jgi:hypothetical protein